MVQPNSSRLNLYLNNGGTLSNITNTNFTNTTAIYATATYDAQ